MSHPRKCEHRPAIRMRERFAWDSSPRHAITGSGMKTAEQPPLTGGDVFFAKRVLLAPNMSAEYPSNERFTSGNCLRSSEFSLRASKPPTGFDGESSRTRSSLPLAFFGRLWASGFRLWTQGKPANCPAVSHLPHGSARWKAMRGQVD